MQLWKWRRRGRVGARETTSFSLDSVCDSASLFLLGKKGFRLLTGYELGFWNNNFAPSLKLIFQTRFSYILIFKEKNIIWPCQNMVEPILILIKLVQI